MLEGMVQIQAEFRVEMDGGSCLCNREIMSPG
jgi:hypothetical protein